MSANKSLRAIKQCAHAQFKKPQLLLLDKENFQESVILASFDGKRSFLLHATADSIFLGLDNQLLMSKDLLIWETVLKTPHQQNFFWHMTETRNGLLFAQEYGPRLTGIYKSSDSGISWKQMIYPTDIDSKSNHFHSIAYDRYRELLIATLGDSNLIKVAVSEDDGSTWKSLYSSAFQCLPIVVTQEFVVFGMDSSISRGLIVWNPSKNKMEAIHLNYVGKDRIFDIMQICDLKFLSNGVWLMATGQGSLLSSLDLRNWHILRLGRKKMFESNMISNDKNGIVSASIGDEVMIFELNNLKDISQSKADIKQYRGLLPRFKGLGYVTKKTIQYIPFMNRGSHFVKKYGRV